MAILSSVAIARTLVRFLDTGIFLITHKPVLPATTNGDSQVIFTMPAAGRISSAHLRAPATLGAGATLKLQKRDVDTGIAIDLTATTTAATAGVVTSVGIVPLDFKAGDTIEVLIGGANSTAGVIEVDVNAQRA